MPQSASVVDAAQALAEWAHQRRRTWTVEPIPSARGVRRARAKTPEVFVVPAVPPVLEVAEILVEPAVVPVEEVPAAVPDVLPVLEPVVVQEFPDTPDAVDSWDAPQISEIREPEAAEIVQVPAVRVVPDEPRVAWINVIAARIAVTAEAAIEGLDAVARVVIRLMLPLAGMISLASVILLVVLNRGWLLSRLDSAKVAASAALGPALNPPRTSAVPKALPIPKGMGRVSVSAPAGAAVLVDGTARGVAPMTADLAAGTHRLLVKSDAGSVERVVRVQAGEASDLSEAIFPGWIAVTAPIELTVSEDGHPLKRDERGWSMVPPGSHTIHLDNRSLGVHETRTLVVTPGGTTRVSFAPLTSSISLTANEPAEVWIDGASFGETPIVDQPIGLGTHDIRVRSAQHERWLRVRATVQPVTVNVDLTAQ